MAAPRPSAGPFTAATIGFLNWMKVLTKVLRERERDTKVRHQHLLMVSHQDAMVTTSGVVPNCFSHLDALLLPVIRQASDEIQEVKATAEDAPDGTEQHQLTVI